MTTDDIPVKNEKRNSIDLRDSPTTSLSEEHAPSVFLVPYDADNFSRTVLTQIDISEHPDHPAELTGYEKVRLWGVRVGSGNYDEYERMKPGDLLLFYHDGRYFGVGTVGKKFKDTDEWVSTTFWQDAPSYHIYTIENYRQKNIPMKIVNQKLGYVDKYYPRGIIHVAIDDATRRLSAIFGELLEDEA